MVRPLWDESEGPLKLSVPDPNVLNQLIYTKGSDDNKVKQE